MKFEKIALRFGLAVICCVTAQAQWQQASQAAPAKSPAKPSSRIDAQSEQALKHMCDFYRSVKTIKTDVDATMILKSPQQNQTLPALYHVSIEKPNKYAIELVSTRGGTVVSNGQRAEFYFAPQKKYMIDKAPPTLLDAFQKHEFRFVTAGLLDLSLIRELMDANPYTAVMKTVKSAQYLGVDQVAGHECHHIKLFDKDIDRDIWINKGDPPIIAKVDPNMTQALSEKAQASGAKMLLSMIYKDQSFNKSMNDGRFETNHPKGTKFVREFFHEEGGELLGKPAPEVTLPLIDGTEVKLSSLRDRFVILDFWATWCGPCVASMPVFAKESQHFKSKNVVFIAVNKGEQANEVKRFMSSNAIHVPVALDTSERISAAYNVSGIPCTVFIGKGGIVRGYHVGINPSNIKESFIADVNKFIEGKSLKREE